MDLESMFLVLLVQEITILYNIVFVNKEICEFIFSNIIRKGLKHTTKNCIILG